MTRLTDRVAMRRALHIAIETEKSIIDAWAAPGYASDEFKTQLAKENADVLNIHYRNIAAFERVSTDISAAGRRAD